MQIYNFITVYTAQSTSTARNFTADNYRSTNACDNVSFGFKKKKSKEFCETLAVKGYKKFFPNSKAKSEAELKEELKKREKDVRHAFENIRNEKQELSEKIKEAQSRVKQTKESLEEMQAAAKKLQKDVVIEKIIGESLGINPDDLTNIAKKIPPKSEIRKQFKGYTDGQFEIIYESAVDWFQNEMGIDIKEEISKRTCKVNGMSVRKKCKDLTKLGFKIKSTITDPDELKKAMQESGADEKLKNAIKTRYKGDPLTQEILNYFFGLNGCELMENSQMLKIINKTLREKNKKELNIMELGRKINAAIDELEKIVKE